MLGVEYRCVAFRSEGTVVLNQVPSPKLQFQLVGEFVDVSVNFTVSGVVPDVTLDVKSGDWRCDIVNDDKWGVCSGSVNKPFNIKP